MKPEPRLRPLPGAGAATGRLQLRLLTWNVNGLRALGRRLRPRLETMRADISALQETRVTREGLPEELAIIEGFSSYFSHSRTRPGYSGVATYCRDEVRPFWAEEGLSGLLTLGVRAPGIGHQWSDTDLRQLDSEGRAVITKHHVRLCEGETATLAVVNVYVPRADPDCPPRQAFKLRFLQLLEARVNGLLQQGEHVIVLGDLNIAHRPIDHCDPGDLERFAMDPSRQWMDRFLSPPSRGPREEEGTAGPREGPLMDGYRTCQGSRCPGETRPGDGPLVDGYRPCQPSGGPGETGAGEGPMVDGYRPCQGSRGPGETGPLVDGYRPCQPSGGPGETGASEGPMVDWYRPCQPSGGPGETVPGEGPLVDGYRLCQPSGCPGETGPGEGPMVDAYRLCQPARRDAYTCWRLSTGARVTNYGARIDYLLVSAY